MDAKRNKPTTKEDYSFRNYSSELQHENWDNTWHKVKPYANPCIQTVRNKREMLGDPKSYLLENERILASSRRKSTVP